MEKVTFKIVSAEEDYKALLKYNMLRKKMVPVTAAVGTAVAVIALAGSMLHLFPIPMILYYFSLAWILLMFFALFSVRGQLKNTSRAARALVGRVMEFEIGESGILERDAETEAEIELPWDHIHEVKETREYFFIYVTHNQCFIIPKAQIGEETSEQLDKVLKFYGPTAEK